MHQGNRGERSERSPPTYPRNEVAELLDRPKFHQSTAPRSTMFLGRVRRWAIIALVALVASVLIAFLRWGATDIVPLIGSGAFAENGEYPSDLSWTLRGPRYASWNGSDANRGTLVSQPFRAGIAVEVFVDGYPRNAGEALYLERVADGARIDLRPTANPGQVWSSTVTRMPRKWIGKLVQLHAIDDSSAFMGWLGVADVRSLDLLELFAPWRVLTALLLIAAAVLALRAALRVRTNPLLDRPAAFLTVASAALIMSRMFAVSRGDWLDADEAQMTAQAITFAHHPVFWRDIDGTTSGPLNTALLALPAMFGIAPTLQSSRLIGILLLIGALIALYGALRRIAGEGGARLAVLLGVAFFSGATSADQLGYASELLPICASALALAFIAEAPAHIGRLRYALVIASGVAMGAMPLAKFQSAPIAAVLTVYAALRISAEFRGRARSIAFFALAAGILALPVIVCGGVALAGGWPDLIYANLVFPREYLASNCCAYQEPAFFFYDAPIAAFLVCSIGTGLIFTAVSLQNDRIVATRAAREHWLAFATFFLMLVVSIYSIEAPHTRFPHYLLFLVVPVVCLDAMFIGGFLALPSAAIKPASARKWLLSAAALAALGPAIAGSLMSPLAFSRDFYSLRRPSDPNVIPLRAIIKPQQTVAMWGWSPQYIVYTDALLGTRDAISQFQIEARPFKPYYRARYLRDFEQSKPDYVLEAVGPDQFAFHDRITQGIDAFPALADIVHRSYVVVLSSRNIRLFQRRDLAASRPS